MHVVSSPASFCSSMYAQGKNTGGRQGAPNFKSMLFSGLIRQSIAQYGYKSDYLLLNMDIDQNKSLRSLSAFISA